MNELKDMKISVHCILACLYFLLLPTTIAINSAGNSYLKLASIPIAAYFVITIIFSKKTLHFNSIHLLLCLYTFSTLITLFVSHEVSLAIDTVTGYFLNAALYLCFTVVKYNKRELLLFENTQILLLVILVAITLLSNGSRFDRTTLMIFGQTSDPNYFVGFFIFPLCITIKKIIKSKYRVLYIALALLSIYCIFLSGSRGGLLAIVVTIIAFAFIFPSKIISKIYVMLVGISFVLCTWFIAAPFLPENIIERMSVESVIETGGTGRWYIWKYMFEEIIDSSNKLYFGHGFHTKNLSFYNGSWHQAVAHNHVIQVLFDQGIVGLLVFTMLSVGCFLRCITKRKTVAIAIIGMMALSISLSFNQTTRTFWNLVAYAALNFVEYEDTESLEKLKLSEEINYNGN